MKRLNGVIVAVIVVYFVYTLRPKESEHTKSLDESSVVVAASSAATAPIAAATTRKVIVHTPPIYKRGALKEFQRKWIYSLPKFSYKISSQQGQDGILMAIFSAIGVKNRFFVEFGFNSEQYDGGSGANTYALHLLGWDGLLLDGGNENLTINLHKHMIYPSNICDIFAKYGVPKEPDYVSIDTDTIDVWLYYSLLKCGYRARVFTTEYNPNLPLESTMVFPPNKHRVDGTYYGSPIGAFQLVDEEFGYEIVYVEHTLDVFHVRKDLLEGADVPPLSHWKKHTGIDTTRGHGRIKNRLAATRVNFSEWRKNPTPLP